MERSRRTAATAALAAIAILTGLLSACGPGEDDKNQNGARPATTLDIVAGSEQKAVLEQIVVPWCRTKGYTCSYTLMGSVDQARTLNARSGKWDAYWFASSVFSQLGNNNGQLSMIQPMFLTPVVYAGFKPTMQRLGLVGKDTTIAQIITSVESGKAKVWATNPTQSNSGATALFSFLNYYAGNQPGQALTKQQLGSPKVAAGLKAFFSALDRTPPSTGTMTEQCIAEPDQCQTMFTYEDLVIEKNLELTKAGHDPLYVAYPRGALAISDAPLGFADHGQPEVAAKRAIFTELQNYLLKDPDARAKLLGLGRRPAGGVGLTLSNPDLKVFNPDWGIKATIREQGITYPAAPVIEAALDAYHTRFRQPVNIFYCLDGSGSMNANGGWDGVKSAAHELFDPVRSRANLLITAPGDTTNVAVFNSDLKAGPWAVTGNDPAQLKGLETKITGTGAGGGTDMYTCLTRAVKEVRQGKQPKKLIVVMSDGQSVTRQASATLVALRAAQVPVITIAFGKDADPGQLKQVAEATNGTFVQRNDLVSALREAAGYK